MPYSERVAEAYIEAKDKPRQQDMLVRQGQFDKDPVTGESYANPKWRLPTKEEADKTMAKLDGIVAGVGTFAGGLGPVPLGVAAIGGGAYLGNRPAIENDIRSKASEPVFENWDENDYQNYYRNWD
ncbi:hypothetical protein [Fundidesulfovibrio terrae]|uniref:hypothetical protein n=1 Tax=Fundidesulfovibrio terrae TaxID=2922866 RepID=UPI001FAE96BD|nr:hypothetical protein [Fundidesulfovibrio terrae]